MRNLASSLRENGLTSRTHGNRGKTPKHSLTFQQREDVRFLSNHMRQHGLVLPGRVPSYSKADIRLLPSCMFKRSIWRTYKEAGDNTVAYSTFCQLWRDLVPDLVVMKPMSDLCWQCQQHSSALQRCSNRPLQEKSATLAKYTEHLRTVSLERSYFNQQLEECKVSLKTYLARCDRDELPSMYLNNPPNSLDIKSHLSFDYAQQVKHR